MPDDFTVFQDFGGADFLFEADTPLDAEALVADLFPELVDA